MARREGDSVAKARAELKAGMSKAKCRKCGCMGEAIRTMRRTLDGARKGRDSKLLDEANASNKKLRPTEYACLGCQHCYGAEVLNAFSAAFPEAAEVQCDNCDGRKECADWPPVPGDYHVLCQGRGCCVAVSTLASPLLADQLAKLHPEDLCIVGKTETENIGIEKIIKNTISNPNIRYLVLAGKEAGGHLTGQTLLALSKNGVNDDMKVIGSQGKRPVLRNITKEEVELFARQVKVVDMIGCENIAAIADTIAWFSQDCTKDCVGGDPACPGTCQGAEASATRVDAIKAKAKNGVRMDKAGYFVIIPDARTGLIIVEHYSYDNVLLRRIEGRTAKELYSTIIESGWVTLLSHAAYLGKELGAAEMSLKIGSRYVQDGA